jgi:putative membrane protein
MSLLSKEKMSIWIFLLIIIHIVGVVGLNLSISQDFFRKLSELNLFLSALFVFFFHPFYNKSFIKFCLSVFTVGMLVEIVGVKTGLPFGHYYYSDVLKIQLLSVPIIIGINWVVLTYSTAIIAQKVFQNKVARLITGAGLMVGLDIILEHFAVKHNLWIWENSHYPEITNFIGWFVIALLTHFLYQHTIDNSENKMAVYYFFVLLVFLILDAVFGITF